MNVSLRDWNTSYEIFESQVREFNNKMQQSMLSEEELNALYETVKKETHRLSELARAAKKREKELTTGKCCSSTSKTIWLISLLNSASKICAIAGAAFAIKENEEMDKWIGVGIFILGEVFDLGTSIFETKLFFETDEISKLAKLNRTGVKHAKIFKRFLKQLKEIKALETRLLEEYQLHNQVTENQVIINLDKITKTLDDRITDCLRKYEGLPNRYRREDVYCRVISHLIQRLPADDSIRKELERLEPTYNSPISEADISKFVDKPLPVCYLPTRKKKFIKAEPISSKSPVVKIKKSNKWKNEEQGKAEVYEEIDVEKTKLKYSQRVAHLKQLVSQRFNLTHNIEFFETPQGWRVDTKEGIKLAASINKKGSNARQSEESSSLPFPIHYHKSYIEKQPSNQNDVSILCDETPSYEESTT